MALAQKSANAFLLLPLSAHRKAGKNVPNLRGRYPYPPASLGGHKPAHKGKHGATSASAETAPAPLEAAGQNRAGSCRFAAGKTPPSSAPAPPARQHSGDSSSSPLCHLTCRDSAPAYRKVCPARCRSWRRYSASHCSRPYTRMCRRRRPRRSQPAHRNSAYRSLSGSHR